MSKQPTERHAETDSRRAVTASDLEVIDQAISAHEGLGRFLYTTRRVLTEVGKLEVHYRGLREAISVVEREGEQINAHLEAAKTALATVQQELVERRKEVAVLDREIKEKAQTIDSYARQVEQIIGGKAAA
jgi:chromosome segregation ATPase